MRLKIASRKSDLARWQSLITARQLGYEDPEFHFKASLGDLDLDTPLANMGQKGVFTEDFYADLVGQRCDMVVHSWKDLPVFERSDTQIAMTLERADMRDLLIVPEVAWSEAVQRGRLRILTSSPRRIYNLQQCLPDLLPARLTLDFQNVRGNVPTRLQKMHAQNMALVLAKAGLDRLLEAEGEGFTEISLRQLIKGCRLMVLPLSLNPGAAAQGAIAVEIRRNDQALKAQCALVGHRETFKNVTHERSILAQYGGGCQQKIGVAVLRREYGEIIALRGLTEQGEELRRWQVENSVPWQRALTNENVFPHHASDNLWFERLPVVGTIDLSSKPALLVARREALPKGFLPTPQQLVWTAGLKTWTQLAKLNVWVNGSFEGLGEAEDPRLETLMGKIQWTKVSHLKAPASHGRTLAATYELKPRFHHPDLTQKTHFFWLSRSAFERAYELFPAQIRNGFNACGPGHTYEHLRRLPDLKNPLKVFIDLPQFLGETLPVL